MKKNKGYSMIEMMIVIAIMAILTGVAVVSMSMIKKAKAQDVVRTFNSQVTNAWLQTKAIGKKQTSMYVEVTTKKDSNGKLIPCKFLIKDLDTDGKTIIVKEETALTSNPESDSSARVRMEYVASTPSNSPGAKANQDSENVAGDNPTFIIRFDKATGEVVKGAGTYTFTDDGGNVVASVYIDAVTGNHYIK